MKEENKQTEEKLLRLKGGLQPAHQPNKSNSVKITLIN
jgi:hypothetical protein